MIDCYPTKTFGLLEWLIFLSCTIVPVQNFTKILDNRLSSTYHNNACKHGFTIFQIIFRVKSFAHFQISWRGKVEGLYLGKPVDLGLIEPVDVKCLERSLAELVSSHGYLQLSVPLLYPPASCSLPCILSSGFLFFRTLYYISLILLKTVLCCLAFRVQCITSIPMLFECLILSFMKYRNCLS